VRQVLVATDVLAEGIDVPACNVVVCFDEIQNTRCFAQMRGRARSKDGSFIALVGSGEGGNSVMRLEREADHYRLGALPGEEVGGWASPPY
jgi:ERCC4-related helicase